MKEKTKFLINHILYTVIQCTWGIIQNIIGGIAFIVLFFIKGKERKIRYYHGAIVSDWKFKFSMGCGMFIFFGHGDQDEKYQNEVLCHEYGHTIQSLILGPLFMFVIAIPSCVWAFTPIFQKWRKEEKYSYFDLYCEGWANKLGEAVLHIDAPSKRKADKKEEPSKKKEKPVESTPEVKEEVIEEAPETKEEVAETAPEAKEEVVDNLPETNEEPVEVAHEVKEEVIENVPEVKEESKDFEPLFELEDEKQPEGNEPSNNEVPFAPEEVVEEPTLDEVPSPEEVFEDK